MIKEEYQEKEFIIDEGLWDLLLANFRKNLALFKEKHKNNYVTMLMPIGPIDLVKFIYEELAEAHLLNSQKWPLVIDNEWIDKHYKNFTVSVVIVDEQEREMGDGDITVYGDFIYEESNW